MKQFLRHIFFLLALFMATANVWAQKPENYDGIWYSLYDEGIITLKTIDSESRTVFPPKLIHIHTVGQHRYPLIRQAGDFLPILCYKAAHSQQMAKPLISPLGRAADPVQMR